MWVQISWLLEKPADRDLHCFQKSLCLVSFCFKQVYIWVVLNFKDNNSGNWQLGHTPWLCNVCETLFTSQSHNLQTIGAYNGLICCTIGWKGKIKQSSVSVIFLRNGFELGIAKYIKIDWPDQFFALSYQFYRLSHCRDKHCWIAILNIYEKISGPYHQVKGIV